MNYDFRGAFIFAMVLAGILGWGIIELTIWICKHISIGWG